MSFSFHRKANDVFQSRRRTGSQHGFTLIELLVVISIIALLISILLPALQAARKTAQMVQGLSNQRQVGVALFGWANDHDGTVLMPEVGWTKTWSDGTTYYPFKARNWPDNLIDGGYVSDRRLAINRYHGVSVSTLPVDSVFGCPSARDPGAYSTSGTKFPNHGSWRSSGTVYGLRAFNIAMHYPTEELKSFTVGGVTKYQLPRLSTVKQGLPFLGDDVWEHSSYTAETEGLNLTGTSPTSYGGVIDRRHQGAANLWFPDGHAASLNKRQINALPPAPYIWNGTVLKYTIHSYAGRW